MHLSLSSLTGILGSTSSKQQKYTVSININILLKTILFCVYVSTFFFLFSFPYETFECIFHILCVLSYYTKSLAVIGVVISFTGIYVLGNNTIYFKQYPIMSRVMFFFFIVLGAVCLCFLFYKVLMEIASLLNPSTPGPSNPSGGSSGGPGGPGGPSGSGGGEATHTDNSRKRRRSSSTSSSWSVYSNEIREDDSPIVKDKKFANFLFDKELEKNPALTRDDFDRSDLNPLT